MSVRSLGRVTINCLASNTRCITSTTRKISEVTEAVKPWKSVPGPPSLPIIGQIHHFLPKGSLYKVEGRDLATNLYKKYGPIVRVNAMFGRPPLLFLFDPASTAMILHGENWAPLRPAFASLDHYRTNIQQIKQGDRGLLSDQGEDWKKFRSVVNPVLLQPKTIKLYEAQINDVADDMILRMKSKLDDNNMIKDDLLLELNLWSLESIGLIALGGRLNCLDPNLPCDSHVHKLIECIDKLFSKFDDLNYGLSIWRWFPTKMFKEAMQSYEDQHRITKYFIDIAKKEFQKEMKPESLKSVLQKLLEIDENIANITANDMLIGGVDTTSNAIINTMYFLAKNQDKQDKLREEVISGTDQKYLKACFKESFRLMPVSSASIRQTQKEYNILGYKVPKGALAFMYHHHMSLSEDQYPRAQEFIPERWLVSKEDPLSYRHADLFVYNPFGFGVRSCIGKRIAELEIETMLSKIIKTFKLEWFGPPMTNESHFVNNVKGPFNFKYIKLT